MTHRFDDAIVAAVLHHMNDDHSDDNLLIACAYGEDADSVASSTMTGFDGDGGNWSVTRTDGSAVDLRVPWPGGPISERPEVRREIVALYDESCRRLGVEPRPHD